MFVVLANIINILVNILVLLIMVHTALTFFVSPYHSVRVALDRILEPLYAPIRRIVPMIGPVDITPWIAIILVEILAFALTKLLYSI